MFVDEKKLWDTLKVSSIKSDCGEKSFQVKRSLNNMNKIEFREAKKGIKKFETGKNRLHCWNFYK